MTDEAISRFSQPRPCRTSGDRPVTGTLVPAIVSHKQDILEHRRQVSTAKFFQHMPEYLQVILVNRPPRTLNI